MSKTILDLQKSEKVILDLKKIHNIENVTAEVVIVIDYSGSAANLYSSGYIQRLFERIIPIAMAFDPNKEMEVYKFHNECMKISTPLTLSNYQGYVNKYVNNSNFGGTEYAPAISKVINNSFDNHNKVKSKNDYGLLSRIASLFSCKKQEENTQPNSPSRYPTLVIFITDGENSDISATEKALIEASYYPAFFQFVGLGLNNYPQLEKLDNLSNRFIDNAGFFALSEKNLMDYSDEKIYDLLLKEFPMWLRAAYKLGMFQQVVK